MSGPRKPILPRSAKPDVGALIERFRTALRYGHGDLALRLWNQQTRVRQAYAGKSQLSFSDIVSDFSHIIDLKLTPIIDYVWRDNKKLHAWFCHEEVDGCYIDRDSLIQLFECAVLRGQSKVANAIWNRCKDTLSGWYKDRPSIELFKASLFFNIIPVMLGIWNASKIALLTYYQNLFSSEREIFYQDFLFYSQFPNSQVLKELMQINQAKDKDVEVKRKAEDDVEDCKPRKKLKTSSLEESLPTISAPATPSQMGFFSESELVLPAPAAFDEMAPLPPLTEEQLDMLYMQQYGFY